MKAVVIVKPGALEVQEVPSPEVTSGSVLVKVLACAICGTDQRVFSGEKHVDVPIVGHEIVGIVVKASGPIPYGVREGDRVVIQTVVGCGKCRYCRKDHQNLCEVGFRAIGYQWNGGFAEYLVMPPEAVQQGCLIPIPQELNNEVATLVEPLSCCINGMRYIPFEGMENVLIFGGGIIGVLNGLVARARGANKITIVDVSEERLKLHQQLGLPFDNWINSSVTDVRDWVRNYTRGGGMDAVIIAASVPDIVLLGLELLSKGGHLSIFAGMPKSDSQRMIDLNRIHYLELNIHGANSSVRRDYLEAIELLTSGKIQGERLITHQFPLMRFHDAINIQKNPNSGALKVIIVP